MGQSSKPTSGTAKVPNSGTTLLILGTIANTTWRMFTPVIVLLIVGMQLDKRLGHRPLWSLAGVVLGFAIAVWLVYMQYHQVATTNAQSDESTKESQ